MIPKTFLEKMNKWGLPTAKADRKGQELIKEFGWTELEDGLWLAPEEYNGSYLEGTKTTAIVAAHIERVQVGSVRKAIIEAAEVFPKEENK